MADHPVACLVILEEDQVEVLVVVQREAHLLHLSEVIGSVLMVVQPAPYLLVLRFHSLYLCWRCWKYCAAEPQGHSTASYAPGMLDLWGSLMVGERLGAHSLWDTPHCPLLVGVAW